MNSRPVALFIALVFAFVLSEASTLPSNTVDTSAPWRDNPSLSENQKSLLDRIAIEQQKALVGRLNGVKDELASVRAMANEMVKVKEKEAAMQVQQWLADQREERKELREMTLNLVEVRSSTEPEAKESSEESTEELRTVVEMNGKNVTLPLKQKTPLILQYWFSPTCRECVEEQEPLLKKVVDKFAGQNIEFAAINMDIHLAEAKKALVSFPGELVAYSNGEVLERRIPRRPANPENDYVRFIVDCINMQEHARLREGPAPKVLYPQLQAYKAYLKHQNEVYWPKGGMYDNSVR